MVAIGALAAGMLGCSKDITRPQAQLDGASSDKAGAVSEFSMRNPQVLA